MAGHVWRWGREAVSDRSRGTVRHAGDAGAAGRRFRLGGGFRLGGRFRLDERISVGDRISGSCGASAEACGLSLWKATDELLGRPVTIYLLPAGQPVPDRVVQAARSAAKVCDSRLATIYDTDFSTDRPYIVAEWAPGTHLEDLVLSGLPSPALAAAMIADAADALAIAHQAGRPHLRLTPRSLRWDPGTGLKITGLGLDVALCGPADAADVDPRLADPTLADPMLADTRALARMLYALLTGFWPGTDATALPPAPRHKGQVCTPRQVRAGLPAILDAIAWQGMRGQAPDAPSQAADSGRARDGAARGAAAVHPAGRSTRTPPAGPAAAQARAHPGRPAAPHDAAARGGSPGTHRGGRRRSAPARRDSRPGLERPGGVPGAVRPKGVTAGRGPGPGPGPAAGWAAAGRCPCRSAAGTAG